MLLPGTLRGVLLMVLMLLMTTVGQVQTGCPRACFCNELSKTVYCSHRGLTALPDGIPRDTRELNLNGNVFESVVIQRSNFSRFVELEHLYLGGCGIETIHEDAFRDLVNLQYLDLNNNRIKELKDHTFRGLSLMHLFLNGNRNIQLSPRSLEGLVTTGLYLHDCSLSLLSLDVLMPLNETLRYLWLNGNQIERIDKSYLALFSSLRHLRFNSNPLHCNCEMEWFKQFYDQHENTFNGAMAPSCLTPLELKGKFFNELSLVDFRCQAPVFNNIDAVLDDGRGKLKCTATGDPAPTLYWIQPSGKSNRYYPPIEEDARHTEGLLVVGANDAAREELSGMYICVAHNEAGSVTLTLNVTWPQNRGYDTSQISPKIIGIQQSDGHGKTVTDIDNDGAPGAHHQATGTPHSLIPTPPSNGRTRKTTTSREKSNNNNNIINNNNNNNNNNYNNNFTANMYEMTRRSGQRLFSVTELIGAIIGTHVCTLLLCLIFMPLYYKKKWHRERHDSLEKQHPPHETLYLNGHGHHPIDHYMDTPSPAKR